MYESHPTMTGDETYVLDGDGETFAICVGDDHAKNAQLMCDLLNAYEPQPSYATMLRDEGENGAG